MRPCGSRTGPQEQFAEDDIAELTYDELTALDIEAVHEPDPPDIAEARDPTSRLTACTPMTCCTRPSTSGCAVRARPRARSGWASPTSRRTRSATSSTSRCPRSGATIDAGWTCGELESTKSVSDVYAPVTGEVVARNDSLDATPELVNNDPYGGGWLFEVVPSDPSQLDGLLDAATYQESLGG